MSQYWNSISGIVEHAEHLFSACVSRPNKGSIGFEVQLFKSLQSSRRLFKANEVGLSARPQEVNMKGTDGEKTPVKEVSDCFENARLNSHLGKEIGNSSDGRGQCRVRLFELLGGLSQLIHDADTLVSPLIGFVHVIRFACLLILTSVGLIKYRLDFLERALKPFNLFRF